MARNEFNLYNSKLDGTNLPQLVALEVCQKANVKTQKCIRQKSEMLSKGEEIPWSNQAYKQNTPKKKQCKLSCELTLF